MAQILNTDCLSHIFFHAVQAPVLSNGSPINLRDIPPLSLASVCKSWRTVIVHHPVLWSYIHVENRSNPHNTRAPMHPSFLRFVQLWLENSKSVPLSIHFRVLGLEEDLICGDILRLILSEQERWGDICINVSNTSIYDDHPIPIPVRCSPPLSAIQLVLTFPAQPTGFKILLDLSALTAANEETSRLSKVDIRMYMMRWGLPQRQDLLSLPKLTELRFHTDLSFELDATFAVLSASPNLRSLWIFDEASDTGSPIVTPRDSQKLIILSHLVDFTITVSNRYNTVVASDFLLEFLSCPSLLQFCLDTSQYLPARPDHLRRLASFFSRQIATKLLPPPPLVELRLMYRESVDDIPRDSRPEHLYALIELLRPLHHLERLELWNIFFDDRLVEELIPRNRENDYQHSKVMLPSIANLDIGWYQFWEGTLSVDLMEEMLVSRAKVGKSLTGVRIGAPFFEDFGERNDQMRTLVGSGLVITVPEVYM